MCTDILRNKVKKLRAFVLSCGNYIMYLNINYLTFFKKY